MGTVPFANVASQKPAARPVVALVALLVAVAGATSCAANPGPAKPGNAATETVDLVVAATTDVHGRLTGWDYYAGAPDASRGLSRAATIVDSVRAANPDRVVLVDAGDMLQGNPLSFVAARIDTAQRNPAIVAMNAMRYDAAAIGNHDFGYGLSTLGRAIKDASFPLLAANAYLASGPRAYPAYVIVKRGGVRLGIVGATTPGAMLWERDNLRGRVVLRDIVAEVRTAVAEARAKGADGIVVVLHSGLSGGSGYDTVAAGVGSENVAARVAREVPGIDLIVFGHSHQELADTVINGTRLLQPKNWATSVGVAHLTLERTSGAWRVARTRGTTVQSAGHAEQAAVVSAVARAHAATVAYVNRVVGSTPVAWRADSARVRDTPLIDFILEVERRAANADLASTAAFSLDASLDAGPITEARLARLYPYDNTLRAIRISGRQLRDYLEFSARYFRTFAGDTGRTISLVNERVPGYNYDIVAGADYVIDVSRPAGSRVVALSVDGKPVADTDTFTMAVNNYRQSGGGGYAMLRGAPIVYDQQQEIRELLIEEVARRKTLTAGDLLQAKLASRAGGGHPRGVSRDARQSRGTRRWSGAADWPRGCRRSASEPDASASHHGTHASDHRDQRLSRGLRAASGQLRR